MPSERASSVAMHHRRSPSGVFIASSYTSPAVAEMADALVRQPRRSLECHRAFAGSSSPACAADAAPAAGSALVMACAVRSRQNAAAGRRRFPVSVSPSRDEGRWPCRFSPVVRRRSSLRCATNHQCRSNGSFPHAGCPVVGGVALSYRACRFPVHATAWSTWRGRLSLFPAQSPSKSLMVITEAT